MIVAHPAKKTSRGAAYYAGIFGNNGFIVDWRLIAFEMFDNPFHFLFGNKRALNTFRFGKIGGEQQHVAPAEQFIGSRAIQDGARINNRCYRKGDTAGNIGFHQTGNNFYTRSLGGND